MHRSTFRKALGLGSAIAVLAFGGAYAIGTAAVSGAAPVDEHGRPDVIPSGPAELPSQAADRARQAIAERGRDAHAQGPKADPTTDAAPTGEPADDADAAAPEGAGEGAGPGYGPGVHAGPHGDYGPGNHPDSENHPGGDDHPDADNHPDTSNHPGGKPTQ